MSQIKQNTYDLIIVGGGAMGMSTAYYASKKVKRILVIDRFDYFLPNSDRLKSNSAGATRQFRVQYSEKYMAKLAMEAKGEWEKLEERYGVELVSKVGSLWFGDVKTNASEGQITKAMETMNYLNIPYEAVDHKDLEDKYNFTNVPEHWAGFFQKYGGTINVPATFQLFYDKAVESGNVTFQSNTQVMQIHSDSGGVEVETDRGIFSADKVVIAAGPYTNDITKSLGFELDVVIWQMVSCYFKKRHPAADYPSWFYFGKAPEWYDPSLYYGFEEVNFSNPGFIRVAPAFALHRMRHPNERTNQPNDMDLYVTERWVQKHMTNHLYPEARFKSSCMAALPVAEKKKMFLDFAPLENGEKNVVVFTAGWAFKYTPIIGQVCVDLALEGKTNYEISQFEIPNPSLQARGVAAAPMEEIKQTLHRLPF